MLAGNALDTTRKSGGSNLVRLDGRTRVARRVAALRRVYTEAVGAVTPVVAVRSRRTKSSALIPASSARKRINDAATLKAIAERSRERKAEAAVKALGLPKPNARPTTPSLAEYLESKAGAKA